tara:strand:+ start:920 stop:1231 length:312 start_codon:yes stop_codon:yes gene_type:complete
MNMTFNNKILSLEENQKELNTIILTLQNEISTLKAQITNMHETFNNTLSLILRNNNNTKTRVTKVSSDDSSSSDSSDNNTLQNPFENNRKNKKRGNMNRRRAL